MDSFKRFEFVDIWLDENGEPHAHFHTARGDCLHDPKAAFSRRTERNTSVEDFLWEIDNYINELITAKKKEGR